MIRLLLIRHAKSSWDHTGLGDHDRPLNGRGRRDAPLIGRWLAARGLIPDHALVSTAARARETWAALSHAIGERPSSSEPHLYEADPEAILSAIRQAPAATLLAVVGHNPGMGEAALRLLEEPPAEPAFRKYPTGAVALIGFSHACWREIGWGEGRLEAFATPKGLDGRY